MVQKRYNWVNALRFLAILHIFLYHYFQYLFSNKFLQNLISSGYYSTSIFFILSGFMLTAVYSNKIEYPNFKKKFWIARFSKTYPLYFVSLVFYLLQYLISNDMSSSFAYTAIGLSVVQAWIPIDNIILIFNFGTWSLSALYFFYLCFPYVSQYIQKIISKKLLYIAAFIWIIYFIPSLIVQITGLSENRIFINVLYRNPLFRIPEFIFGMLLAKMAKESDLKKLNGFFNNNRILIILLNLAVLCIAPFFVPEPLFHNGLFLPLQGALILCLLYERESAENSNLNTILNVLGSSSLAFYLINAPMESIIRRIMIFFDLGMIKHYEQFSISNLSGFAKVVEQFPSFASIGVSGVMAIAIALTIILFSVLIQLYFVNPVSIKIKNMLLKGRNEKLNGSSNISMAKDQA